MNLTVPIDGLEEVRALWAGRGGILGAAASISDAMGADWGLHQTQRRARRVAFELLRPSLLSWPTSTRDWVDALPAQSIRRSLVSDTPGAGIDWATTRRAGWPPIEFHHRRRSRVPDTLLATTTRWTIEQLDDVIRDVDRIDPNIVGPESRIRLAAALGALKTEPLASAHPSTPTRQDLTALRSTGVPWGAVTAVADWLRVVDHDPSRLAGTELDPDPLLAERLFHVACLGCLVRGLRVAGWTLRSTRLPGASTGRPLFVATDLVGDDWDLWFEMAGAWSHYGVPSPYAPAVDGITGTGGPLGADLALVRPDDRAILIECKFSADPTYVGRNGYEQVLAYMGEALSGLVGAVAGLVVGPVEVVASTGRTLTACGPVSVISPTGLPGEILRHAPTLAGAAASMET